MTDVTDKIDLLKNAALANVSDVRAMLVRIEAEQKAKQAEQDTAIDQLTARHQQLQQETTEKFKSVDSQISSAETRLAEAKARVASEREEVKKLIMEKIKTDVGGLDKQMTDRLENEKFDIRSTIDAGLKQLDGNISDYSLSTGIRVARLMNKVAVLKKDQKDKAEAQDESIRNLEDDHKELKEQTLSTLGTLRSEVDETKNKLAQAQQTLEAEQALRQSAEEKALNKDTATLHSATEQSLADAKDAVELKIGQSDAWVKKDVAATKDKLHKSVDDLEEQLGAFVKTTKEANADQEEALKQAKETAEGKLSSVEQQAAGEEKQVMQTQTAVSLANAKLKGDVAAQTKELRLKLLDRMTALHNAMATSLAQVRSELEGKVVSDQKTLESDLASAKATSTGVMDSVNADLLQTQTEAKNAQDKSKEELAEVAASEEALSTSTGAEMDALSSEMKTLEDSLADARAKLAAQSAKVEEALEAKLTAGLAGLNGKVDTAMEASRAEVEGKVSGDMSSLSKQIGEASDASKASAQKLDDKVHEVQTAAEGVAAATSSQVASVEKDHAAFETQASQTLAHVETSLASTKSALAAADASIQQLVGQRETDLKSKIKADMKTVEDEMVAKVDKEAGVIKEAHSALEQAITAHKQAVAASVAERKQKLEKLAADLVTLQGKMSEVKAMSNTKVKLAAGAVEQLAARGLASKRRHDHAARSPKPLRMGGDEVPRGERKALVQPEYYAPSVPVLATHKAKAKAKAKAKPAARKVIHVPGTTAKVQAKVQAKPTSAH